MADTNTTNLNLVKPEVGASSDTWGTKINSDLDTIDALFTTGPALLVSKGGTSATTAADARTNLAVPGTGVSNTFTANQVISVTDNTNAALRITQLGTGAAIRVEDETNPDSTPFIVDASGNVGIGTSSPTQPLDVSGGVKATNYRVDNSYPSYNLFPTVGTANQRAYRIQADSGNFSIIGQNDSGVQQNFPFQIAWGGATTIGTTITSQPTYDNTASGSTVVVTSGGLIRRTSSSIKYKKDIEDLDPALADNAISNLRPVWYRTKNAEGDDKPTWSHIGLIAEEVDQVEKRLVRYKTVEVSYDDDGNKVETPLDKPEPEDVDYARLSVLLLDKVKRLEARIAALEAA